MASSTKKKKIFQTHFYQINCMKFMDSQGLLNPLLMYYFACTLTFTHAGTVHHPDERRAVFTVCGDAVLGGLEDVAVMLLHLQGAAEHRFIWSSPAYFSSHLYVFIAFSILVAGVFIRCYSKKQAGSKGWLLEQRVSSSFF